ncbi:MAG: MBL fold metallo-hydrolase, partial [Acidimicrobiales bacterium]
VYVTHLHSDHVCDLFNLFLLGWPILQWNPPVDVYGPGPAGALPPDEPGHATPVVAPANPTPGLVDVIRANVEAHAYDLNIRMREAGRHDLTGLVVPHEIAAASEPVLVTEDGDARVTAILVEHGPVIPAFAFRFDTAAGSVVFSGDTAPCGNLITLARGADILVHEVYDDTVPGDGDGDDDGGGGGDGSWEAERRQHHLTTAHTPLSAVGKIAADAGVRRLVLTHFIPGDDELPNEHWRDGVKDFDGEVIPGHDLMDLTL